MTSSCCGLVGSCSWWLQWLPDVNPYDLVVVRSGKDAGILAAARIMIVSYSQLTNRSPIVPELIRLVRLEGILPVLLRTLADVCASAWPWFCFCLCHSVRGSSWLTKATTSSRASLNAPRRPTK